MKQQFLIFLTRWLGNSLVLAVIIAWPNSGLSLDPGGGLSIFIAGLILTLVNAFMKPLIVVTFLPFLFITLGFFTLLINALMIFITAKFYTGLTLEGWFWGAITGLVVALINYLITVVLSNES